MLRAVLDLEKSTWPNPEHPWLAEQRFDVLRFCESLRKKPCCFNCPTFFFFFPFFVLFFFFLNGCVCPSRNLLSPPTCCSMDRTPRSCHPCMEGLKPLRGFSMLDCQIFEIFLLLFF